MKKITFRYLFCLIFICVLLIFVTFLITIQYPFLPIRASQYKTGSGQDKVAWSGGSVNISWTNKTKRNGRDGSLSIRVSQYKTGFDQQKVVWSGGSINISRTNQTKRDGREGRTKISFTNSTAVVTFRMSTKRLLRAQLVPKVVYNRVPKCGSSATLTLIETLSRRNQFLVIRNDHEEFNFTRSEDWQRSFINKIEGSKRPLVYEKHLHFVNFTSFGAPQPQYINLIRDPLDRMISWYYFRRYQPGQMRQMLIHQRIRTFDECVLDNEPECVEPNGDSMELGYFKIIPFFCGQEAFCRKPTDRALTVAINNVKKYYKIVGVTEQHEKFITALEYVFPSLFNGAASIFRLLARNKRNFRNVSSYRLPVSKEASLKMKQLLRLEYVFYDFVKEHFHQLLKSLGLKRNKTAQKFLL